MALLDIEISPVRIEHPLDVIERVANTQDWMFDRVDIDEISVCVSGQWADYHVSFTWLEDVEAIHIGCAFDLKVKEARLAEMLRLVALINEQLWVGHFDLWSSENIVMFRHALILTDGAEANSGQCEAMLEAAISACERYYQAFQFVLWAGKSARDALDNVLFETEGRA